MKSEPRFAHLIHQAHRSLFRSMDRALRDELGISSAQLGVLYFVHEHPDCTLSTVSRGLMMNNSALTGTVSRMGQAGLVERRAMAGDRRAARLVLTERGQELIGAARPLLQRFNETIGQGFSGAELAVAERFLHQVIRRFAAQDEERAP